MTEPQAPIRVLLVEDSDVYRDSLVFPTAIWGNRVADAFFQPGGFDTVAIQAARLPTSGRPSPTYKLDSGYQGARSIRVMAKFSF